MIGWSEKCNCLIGGVLGCLGFYQLAPYTSISHNYR